MMSQTKESVPLQKTDFKQLEIGNKVSQCHKWALQSSLDAILSYSYFAEVPTGISIEVHPKIFKPITFYFL